MATYTSNYAWTKPGGNDQVDISVLNDNLDSQDAIMHKAFGNMAQAFSQLSTYAVGDIVLYDNNLYKCHTAVTVAGAWTGSTNWTSWTLAEGGGGGGTSDYPDLTNKPSINGVTLSGNKTTSDLGINADNVMLSDGVTSVEDALDELNAKFVLETYTLTYDSAYNLRVTGITPPTGCSLERMIILLPNYDSVTVKVTNFLRISTTGIIAFGSGFVSTDTISLSVLYFKN